MLWFDWSPLSRRLLCWYAEHICARRSVVNRNWSEHLCGALGLSLIVISPARPTAIPTRVFANGYLPCAGINLNRSFNVIFWRHVLAPNEARRPQRLTHSTRNNGVAFD